MRRVMEADLGVPVEQHDDGSKPGMHDLDVIWGEGQRASVEVTAAVDADSTELWNIVNGQGRWVESDLAGGWLVHVKPNARQLRRRLPPFLRSLESAGIREFHSDATPNLAPPPPGVLEAKQSGTDFPGSIYVQPDLPLEQVAGYMADTGNALAEWLGAFLRDNERADVRRKLARSGAEERHAFVIVTGLSGVPFAVTGLLIPDDAPLPIVTPDLPSEVTDVWAASSWDSGVGFRWSSATRRWRRFSKHLPPVSSE